MKTNTISQHLGSTISIRWGTSRGRDTYGYTTCSLRNSDGKRIAACNGGGYDMRGTVVGHWLAYTFRNELLALKPRQMPEQSHYDYTTKAGIDDGRYLYGLTFHDPNYDAGKAIVGRDCSDRTLTKVDGESEGKTVAQAEADGVSFGLERYQAVYRASSKVPTKTHTVPSINGACGISSVLAIARAIGIDLRQIHSSAKLDIYEVVAADRKASAA